MTDEELFTRRLEIVGETWGYPVYVSFSKRRGGTVMIGKKNHWVIEEEVYPEDVPGFYKKMLLQGRKIYCKVFWHWRPIKANEMAEGLLEQ